MPVGAAGCTYVFTFGGGDPPLVDGGGWNRWGVNGAGSKIARGGGSLGERGCSLEHASCDSELHPATQNCILPSGSGSGWAD